MKGHWLKTLLAFSLAVAATTSTDCAHAVPGNIQGPKITELKKKTIINESQSLTRRARYILEHIIVQQQGEIDWIFYGIDSKTNKILVSSPTLVSQKPDLFELLSLASGDLSSRIQSNDDLEELAKRLSGIFGSSLASRKISLSGTLQYVTEDGNILREIKGAEILLKDLVADLGVPPSSDDFDSLSRLGLYDVLKEGIPIQSVRTQSEELVLEEVGPWLFEPEHLECVYKIKSLEKYVAPQAGWISRLFDRLLGQNLEINRHESREKRSMSECENL